MLDFHFQKLHGGKKKRKKKGHNHCDNHAREKKHLSGWSAEEEAESQSSAEDSDGVPGLKPSSTSVLLTRHQCCSLGTFIII